MLFKLLIYVCVNAFYHIFFIFPFNKSAAASE